MRGNRFLPVRLFIRMGSIPTHAGKPYDADNLRPIARVYPHACGETWVWKWNTPIGLGLSPRMRGNRIRGGRAYGHHGSIPTHAGKPVEFYLTDGPIRVYPHACGETDKPGLPDKTDTGLSPRMRGNPSFVPVLKAIKGSIPTHAGKPRVNQCGFCEDRVYPHACGETNYSVSIGRFLPGLSPRMRGNLLSRGFFFHRPGSIPTHAGKPVGECKNRAKIKVYPHACGETP